jgi:hypothetical protein
MGVESAVVRADWPALNSVWLAPSDALLFSAYAERRYSSSKADKGRNDGIVSDKASNVTMTKAALYTELYRNRSIIINNIDVLI